MKVWQRGLKLSDLLVSVVTLLGAVGAVYWLFKPVLDKYLASDWPIGGDYFNALAYADAFAKHLPFPPTGWLAFWHQGSPVIGGYFIVPFYLMAPLWKWLPVASGMNLFMIYSLLLFLVVCLVLFWSITHSSAVSLILTFLVFSTRGSYYQLFAEGFISASSAQWLAPLALLFIYLFSRSKNTRWLILASLATGWAILLHPAIGFLTTLLPSFVVLTVVVWKGQSFSLKTRIIGGYLLMSGLVGSATIYYSLLLIIFSGGGSSACNSPQCWGLYPAHLGLWLSMSSAVLAGGLLIGALVVKLIKRKSSIVLPMAFVIALIILSLYPIASFFHWINSLSSSVFPRRLFWAINLLILLVAASSFRVIMESLGKVIPRVVSGAMLALIAFIVVSQPQLRAFDTKSIFNSPGTIPANVYEYIVPEYQKLPIDQLVPSWVVKRAQTDINHRLDSLNQQMNIWWNSAFSMPTVRGYSNSPIGENADWLYYFQVGTGQSDPKEEPELIVNRWRYLIDQFGVGLYEDSGRNGPGQLGYNQKLILDDPALVKRTQKVRELSYYELSDTVTSPIVEATNVTPMLVVGDNTSYQTLVRALSLTNLTGKKLLPVKGPDSLNDLSNFEIENFPVLFLYHFKGSDWRKIESFLQHKGLVFIETGGVAENLATNLPSFFPVKELQQFKASNNDLPSGFSPFSYQGGWKMSGSSKLKLAAKAEGLLTNDQKVILAKQMFGQGQVYWSGFNLPFHIISNQNLIEAKLLQNMLSMGLDQSNPVKFDLKRPIPEQMVVTGDSFRGIFFRENFNNGWTAGYEGHELKLYKAGMGFMYWPIPKADTLKHLAISIKYQGNFWTWLVFLMSVVSMVLLVMYLIVPWPFRLVGTWVERIGRSIWINFSTRWANEND